MNIVIKTADGNSLTKGISDILNRVVQSLNQSGKTIGDDMQNTVRLHISSKWPGSKHWDPAKVNEFDSTGNVGQVGLSIPGAKRAYEDVTIKPVSKKHLAIPMHSSAYGKRPTEFNDLTYMKTKNGSELLAKRMQNGSLQMMYVLAKSAFQKKDSSLMPSDQTLADNIFKALVNKLEEI